VCVLLFAQKTIVISFKSLKPTISLQKNNVKRCVGQIYVTRDEKGYEIKPKDWFNGLSADPGASLTDPRAVPLPCKDFIESIKSGSTTTFQNTISLIDEHYDYFQVPFSCGDLVSLPNVNVGSAKIFSFALMTRLSGAFFFASYKKRF
jgi:hypothetical protein